MFWITCDKNNPLVEMFLYNQSRKSNYPFIIVKNFTESVKYNGKIGTIVKKDNKIIWNDHSFWIKAPNNLEFVQGKFKSIWSLRNINVDVPINIYLNNNDNNNIVNNNNNTFIDGKIFGFNNEEQLVNVLIGNKYYFNINPGILKIKLPI